MSQRWSAIFCAMGAWEGKPIGCVRVKEVCIFSCFALIAISTVLYNDSITEANLRENWRFFMFWVVIFVVGINFSTLWRFKIKKNLIAKNFVLKKLSIKTVSPASRVVNLRLDKSGRAGPQIKVDWRSGPEFQLGRAGSGCSGPKFLRAGPGCFLPIFREDFANIPQFFWKNNA